LETANTSDEYAVCCKEEVKEHSAKDRGMARTCRKLIEREKEEDVGNSDKDKGKDM